MSGLDEPIVAWKRAYRGIHGTDSLSVTSRLASSRSYNDRGLAEGTGGSDWTLYSGDMNSFNFTVSPSSSPYPDSDSYSDWDGEGSSPTSVPQSVPSFSPPVQVAPGEFPVMDFANAVFAERATSDLFGKVMWPAKVDQTRNAQHLVAAVSNLAGGDSSVTIAQLMDTERSLLNHRPKWDGSFECSMLWLRRGMTWRVAALRSVVAGKYELPQAVAITYSQTLAKHHNFVMRKFVETACGHLPSTQDFLAGIHPNPTIAMQRLNELVSYQEGVLENLTEFYQENGLDPDADGVDY